MNYKTTMIRFNKDLLDKLKGGRNISCIAIYKMIGPL